MSVNNGYEKYYIDGYSFPIGPHGVRPVTIYFKAGGRLINVLGCDVWTKDRLHLGWVDPHNISPEQRRTMTNFIRDHRTKWVRVHD